MKALIAQWVSSNWDVLIFISSIFLASCLVLAYALVSMSSEDTESAKDDLSWWIDS